MWWIKNGPFRECDLFGTSSETMNQNIAGCYEKWQFHICKGANVQSLMGRLRPKKIAHKLKHKPQILSNTLHRKRNGRQECAITFANVGQPHESEKRKRKTLTEPIWCRRSTKHITFTHLSLSSRHKQCMHISSYPFGKHILKRWCIVLQFQ